MRGRWVGVEAETKLVRKKDGGDIEGVVEGEVKGGKMEWDEGEVESRKGEGKKKGN